LADEAVRILLVYTQYWRQQQPHIVPDLLVFQSQNVQGVAKEQTIPASVRSSKPFSELRHFELGEIFGQEPESYYRLLGFSEPDQQRIVQGNIEVRDAEGLLRGKSVRCQVFDLRRKAGSDIATKRRF
jgi:hypothetical protein